MNQQRCVHKQTTRNQYTVQYQRSLRTSVGSNRPTITLSVSVSVFVCVRVDISIVRNGEKCKRQSNFSCLCLGVLFHLLGLLFRSAVICGGSAVFAVSTFWLPFVIVRDCFAIGIESPYQIVVYSLTFTYKRFLFGLAVNVC